MIGVVATESDTTVTVELSAYYTISITFEGTTYTNGQQFDVLLQRFQTLQVHV